MNTPEFLVWSLEYRCPVRGFEDGRDPERTERQLRAARAVSDAKREGRIFEGVAVDPPSGFHVADALAIYGDEASVEQACRHCPANICSSPSIRWAGCYSLVVLPAHDAVVYGLLRDSPLPPQQAGLLADLVADLGHQEVLDEFRLALQVARDGRLPMHVRLYPRGRVEGTWWRLEPHCPRCKAAWPTRGARNATEGVPYSAAARCAVCDYFGHPARDRKRRARGTRPYFPLDRLLGTKEAAEFLVRYEAFRARPESPDPARNPLPPARPDSPPAD